jgi:hypothetical protein
VTTLAGRRGVLGIDISALSMAELRQLLAVARARDQQALAERITAELRARPARSTQWGAVQPRMDITWIDDEPAPPPPMRRRSFAVAATAAAAGVVCAALVWGVSVPQSQVITPTKASAPRAAMALSSLPVAADDPLSDPVPAPDPEPEARTAGAPKAHNACYDLATAAERLICGYPSLAQKDAQLKAAYQAAIAGGADAAALEQEQAAWKAGAAGVSDRLALADLYDRRIRELAGETP